jgi:cbb3-type cytochrome oxidase cytochrome c subunit
VKLRVGEWIVLVGTLLIIAFALLVGTLIWLKPPPARFGFAVSAAADQGEAVYRREACRDCHKVFDNGSSSGPALDGVGSRRSPDWLQAYLVNPRPSGGDRAWRVTMPSYARLPPAERDALVAYLSALAAPAAQRDPTQSHQ